MAIDPKTGTGIVNGYQIGPGADLRGADLRGADLTGANLREADLTGAILHRASIIDAHLTDAVLVDTDFSFSTIEGSRVNGTIVNCNFDNARIAGAVGGISEAFIWNSSFKKTTFSETSITASELLACDFTGSEFYVKAREGAQQIEPNGFIGCTLNIKIDNSYLSYWTFTNCQGYIKAGNCEILYCEFLMSDLLGSEFIKNEFNSTQFSKCNLEGVEFSFVEKTKKSNKKDASYTATFAAVSLSLQFCNLSSSSFKLLTAFALDLFGSDLTYSDFSGARIEVIRIAGAQFMGANWSNVEILWHDYMMDVTGGGPGFEDLCPLFMPEADVKEYLETDDYELYIKKFKSNMDAGILASDIDKVEKERDSFYKELKKRANFLAKMASADKEFSEDFLAKIASAGKGFSADFLAKMARAGKEYPADIRNRVKLKAVEAFPEIFDVLDEQAEIENDLHTRILKAWLKSPVGTTGGFYKICNDQRHLGKSTIIADFTGANLDGAIFNALKSVGGLRLNKASMKKAELVKCDLIYADFVETDLRGATILDSVFNGIMFQLADLRGTTIIGSVINGNFKDADLKGAKILGSSFLSSDLSEAKNLKGDTLARAYLSNATKLPPNFKQSEHIYLRGLKVGPDASLAGADLHGANLLGVNLEGADLSGANLEGADLSYANLLETNLQGANLNKTTLDRTKIIKSDLSDAKLIKAKIKGTNNKVKLKIKNTNLSHADLSDARMRYVSIMDSDLSHANISGAKADYVGIAQSDASNLNAKKMKARSIHLYKNDLTNADFSGSRMQGAFIRNKLKNTSFEGSFLGGPISGQGDELDDELVNFTFGAENKFIKTGFRGARLNETDFTLVEDLGSSDFSNARIIKPKFGHGTDARRASFANAKFLLDRPFEEGGSISSSESSFMLPSLMPKNLREHLKGDIDKHAAARKKAIEADPRYLGMRTGLWIHMTNQPQTKYVGELCVSPYEEGEPIFETRGAYGIVFQGTAPLFSVDVWSEKDRYGGLFPGETPDDWKETFKEGFLDADNSRIVRLNILEGFERPYVIRKFKNAGIPVHSVEGSEKAKKRLAKFRPDAATYKKALSKIEPRDDSGRIANPSTCRVCGQHATLTSRSGAPICEDCY